ncbi:MAG TPA: prenyltransferase [Actinomycetota bacterium]|jgi:1,4-dihydroxy-2-naphthoate octaprenyltransferase|nr:prenyltransferase [Actinomycetota bacterium]
MARTTRSSGAKKKAPVRDRSLLWRWGFVLRTCNPPPGKVDVVSKWLVLVRACVFPLTVTSAAVGGLLAVGADGFDPWLFGLAGAGLLIAHSANNLMNDLFDLESSIDTQNYPRALYAPHPVLSGLISKGGLAAASLVANVLSLAVLVVLTLERGWPVIAFALGGFVISAGYAAPPLRLKKRGLGEPGVFVVWGPLMVGGTYFSATGSIPGEVIAASVPYALLATTVLMGKHIDKLPWDGPGHIGTLPVLLGESAARRITLGMMAGFYVSLGACVAFGALPLPSLVALGAVPRLIEVWRAYGRPRPSEPPKGYPVWPLWFAPAAFVHARRAGALFLAGLGIAAAIR